jgi:hypothetical protein
MQQPTKKEELEYRIKNDIKFFGGTMPERNAIAWASYLAALTEWSLLPAGDYWDLRELLPKIDDDPSIAILNGRDE